MYRDIYAEMLEKKKKKKKTEQNKKVYVPTKNIDLLEKHNKNETVNTGNARIVYNTKKTAVQDKKSSIQTNQDNRTWFQKGAFEDGYQVGDITKTILGTLEDADMDIVTGALGIGEKAIDAVATGVGKVGGFFGADNFKAKTGEFIKKDIIDEKKLAEYILNRNPTQRFFNTAVDTIIGTDEEEASVFGDKTDSLLQSGGQLAAQVALGAAGVPWYLTTGATSFGGSMEEALNSGASYDDAVLSSAITAGADILTEKLFAGSALGESGLIKLDGLTKGISSKAIKALADFGIDVGAEGFEEVAASFITRLGKSLTYAKENTWKELLSNEEAMDKYIANVADNLFGKEARDEYLESAIGGAVLGGLGNVSNVASSIKQGTDYRSGLTAREQKVFDKEVERRIKAEESGDKKLTKSEKNKIYEKARKDLEEGQIDVNFIEEMLDGENYQTYKTAMDEQNALEDEIKKIQDEYNVYYEMKPSEKSDAKADRQKELKAKLDELNSKLDEMKAKTSEMKSNISDGVMSQLDEESGKLKRGSYLAESYAEKGRGTQAYEANLSQYSEKQQEIIQKAIDSKILNNRRSSHKFVDLVAKIHEDKGVDFDFVNNEKLKESGFALGDTMINGYVQDGKVAVNIDSPKYMESIVGHEITHVLEGTEMYAELQKSVKEYANTKGGWDTLLKEVTDKYTNAGIEADFEAELTADLVGDYLFTDTDFINSLSVEDPNLFKKIYDEVKYLCKVATAGSKEARKLEKVKENFKKTYRENVEIQAEDGNIRFSLANKNITKDADISYTINKSYQNVSVNDTKALNKLQDDVRNINKGTYENKATGYKADINSTTIGKILYPKKSFNPWNPKYNYIENLNASLYLSELFENAIYIDSIPPQKEKNSGKKIKEYHHFVSPIEMNNDDYRVLITAREKINSNTLYVVNAEILPNKKQGIPAAGQKPPTINGTPRTIKIADLVSGVKIYDYNTQKNRIYSDKDIQFSHSETSPSKDSSGVKLSEGQRDFFKLAKTVDKEGNLKRYYHGTARGDRVGYYFDPQRATSGPMAFFTDSKEIAERYSKDKQDTSMAYDADYDRYETQFRVNVKGKDMSLIEAWKYLPADAKARIKDRAEHTHYDWDDYETLVYDEETTDAGGGFSWQLREARGNVLQALNEQWLNSGNLFDHESDYIDVLKFVGVYDEFKKLGYSEPYYKDPNYREEKVYETYLNITNPFSTEDVDEYFLSDVYDWLDATDLDYYKKESASSDMWDKNDVDPYEWADKLENDINNGTTHAWTSIPDVITDFLKSQGYDGIFDSGGKNGGVGHQVVIPFYSEQIKNVDNLNPTSDTDIRYSLSDKTSANSNPPGTYGTLGKDIKLDTNSVPFPIRQDVQKKSNDGPFSDDAWNKWLQSSNDDKTDSLQEDIGPVKETVENKGTSFPDDFAPITEERFAPDDNDSIAPDTPFLERDIKEVGNRKVKAYMYENPEVKPYFQEEAQNMLYELEASVKGSKVVDANTLYETQGEIGIWSTKRKTSDDIAYLLDNFKYTYSDIEKGLKAIIEDHGSENNAVSKRIEFMLDERLREGYTLFGYDEKIPPNQEYINLLTEKQVTEYSDESWNQWLRTFENDSSNASENDIAPTKALSHDSVFFDAPIRENGSEKPTSETLETFEEEWADNSADEIAVVKPEVEQAEIAKILDKEPEVESDRNKRKWAIFKANIFDKGAVFEDLSLKTRNRELMGKWDFTLLSEARAQHLIGNGAEGVKSLNDIRTEVENTGQANQFYDYMYHKHNIDRMTLSKKYKDTENKPVFGDSVTAEVSQAIVDQYESANPEFMEYAKDVYKYMNHLQQMLVDNGVISQDTADLWSGMYPHYVPIRRKGQTGNAINVPLDTGRTGVNAPVKKATGGNADILPLFDTMASRTMQTFRATAKNSFGVELKNTLGTIVENTTTNIDEVIDSIDSQDGLLQEGKNGNRPTFTVFENGEKVTFEITKDMYDAIKPLSDSSLLSKTFLPGNIASNIHRGLLTEYNPTFMLTNAIKDSQDVLMNSQHPLKTYAKIPEAYKQMAEKGYWYNEYVANGGQQNSYFNNETNTFETESKGLSKVLELPPFSTISAMNNYIEMAPRLAEYIASREAGRSIEVSMLDASRVTTNFKAGGDLTKFLNRNGATFLNASVQGAMQNIRNIREAKANGIRGYIALATKFAVAGLPAFILNSLVWDDDEEYAELSDYVKQNYYVIGKYDDGKFIRIPKGRAVAVIQEGIQQISNAATGDDEVDFKNFLDLMMTNLAPNNPIDNNIIAPIVQVANNETWYGEDLVPARLQDYPANEQFDESTDSISKYLGEKLNVSPMKINYLLDQYSGGVGDVVLPMLTPEAESGDDTLVGNIIAPLKSKFTTDSVLNNQNVSDFFDKADELITNAKSSMATDADKLKNKYYNSVNTQIGELYAKKREIQSSNLSDKLKYEQVRDIQSQINTLAKNALNTYDDVMIDAAYSTVGDRKYRTTKDGSWEKITDKQLKRQKAVTKALDITPSEYWSNKYEYDYAYDNPSKYAVSKAIGGYEQYRVCSKELGDIHPDKDQYGKNIYGSRQPKVINYINGLDIEYGAKLILYKNEYNSDDTYNQEILDYVWGNNNLSKKEKIHVLQELGMYQG